MPLIHGRGAPQTLIYKVKKIQHSVAKNLLGTKGNKWSKNKRLDHLGWLPIEKLSTLTNLKLTHKIVHCKIPEELATKMTLNTRSPRLIEACKLDTKPVSLMKNKQTRSTYRNRAYIWNTLPNRLTAIADPKFFNKWVKVHLVNPSKLPKIIPLKQEDKKCPIYIRGQKKNFPKEVPNQTAQLKRSLVELKRSAGPNQTSDTMTVNTTE